MFMMSWLNLFSFSRKQKTRKLSDQSAGPRMAEAGRLEELEDRALLSAVTYNALTQQLDFVADNGVDDELQIWQPDGSTLQIQVGAGDTITLQGDAIGNPDFTLIGSNVLNINIGAGHAVIDQLSGDLGDGNNQVIAQDLDLGGLVLFQAGTVQLGAISVGIGGLTVVGQNISTLETIQALDGGGIALVAAGGLSSLNNNLAIHANLTAVGTSGAGVAGTIGLSAGNDLWINNAIVSTIGDGLITATAGFTRAAGVVSMTGDSVVRTETGPISLEAQGTGTITTLGIETNGGDVWLSSLLGNANVNGQIVNTLGQTSIAAGDSVFINHSVTVNGVGAILVSADSNASGGGDVQIGAGALISTSLGNVLISGADVDFTGGSVAAVAGQVRFQPSIAGAGISLGTDDLFGLVNSDLEQIATPQLIVGSSNSGDVVVTAPLQIQTSGAFVVESGGNILQQPGATISVANLALRSAGFVILDEANQVENLTIDLSPGSPGHSVSFQNATSLTVGSVAGWNGIQTNSGAISLRVVSPDSLLAIDQPLTTGAGANIELQADHLELSANVIAGSQSVFINPATDGRELVLGSNVAESLSLTDIELSHIQTGYLVFGQSTVPAIGDVFVTSAVNASHIARLGIINQGAIVDQNLTGIDLTVPTLLIQTRDGFVSPNLFSTAVSGMEVTSEDGPIAIENTGDLTIGGWDNDLHGLTVLGAGNIQLVNHGSVLLNEANTASLNGGTVDGDIHLETIGLTADIGSLINQDLAVAPRGNITVIAGRDFAAGGGGLAWDGDLEADGHVTIIAGRDVLLAGDADLRSDNFGHGTTGGVSVSSGRHLTLQGSLGTAEIPSIAANGAAGGQVQLTAGAGGLLTLAAEDLSANSAMVATISGNINLTADRLAISGGAVVNAAGDMSIVPRTTGWDLDLGSNSDLAADTLELSNGELNHLVAQTLRIGSMDSGDLRITAPVSANVVNIPVLALLSGGDVLDGGVGTLAAGQLRVSAHGHIMLDADGHQVQQIALHSDTGEVGFMNTDDLIVGSVDGVHGVSTNNRSLGVGSNAGRLTILDTPAAHDLDAGFADVGFGAFSVTGVVLNAGANVRGLGGVLVVGNQQELAGTITATGAGVELRTAGPFNPNGPSIPIELGGSDSLDHLGLSDAELDRIDADSIEIGSYSLSAAPVIRVLTTIDPALATTLVLNGDSVVQAGGLLRIENLILLTESGAGDSLPLRTQVSRLAFYNQDSGDVNLENTGALTLAGLSGFNASVNLAGAVHLTTHSPLIIASGLLAAGDISLHAIESLDPGDDLTIQQNVVVVSTGGSVTLSAGDTLYQLGTVAVQVSGATMTLAGGHDDLDGFGGVTLSGELTTYDRSPEILGGTGADTIVINRNAGVVIGNTIVGLNINGGTGNDTYHLNFDQGPFSRDIAIADASGFWDQLQIQGKPTDDTVSYDSSLFHRTIFMNERTITFTGMEMVAIDALDASGDVLHLVENVAGFLPVEDGTVQTNVPLTFANFETVTITNTLPVISGMSVTQSTEGGPAILTGTFDDAEQHLGETFVLRIDWGDGSPLQIIPLTYSFPNQTFSVTHYYLDDNPTGSPQDDYQVSVVVKDDNGGASAASNSTATVQDANPTLFVLNFSTATNEGGVLTFTGTYADAGVADTHTLSVDWNDGTPIETYTLSQGVFAVSHTYTDEDLAGTSTDIRTPTLTLHDDDGGTAVSQPLVLVHNMAPTIETLNVTASVVEGDAVTLSGTYSDPGILDTHTLLIDWGDGSSPQVVTLSNGEFSIQHVYGDDITSGTDSDTLSISVVLTDNDGASSAPQSISTTVTNSVPSLTDLTLTPAVYEQGIATLTGVVVDAGTLDTHVIEIDWGDGSPLQVVTVTGPAFEATHQYLDDNPSSSSIDDYTVTVTVRDDDLGAWSASGVVTVVNRIPVVESVELSATAIDENGTVTLSGTYSDVGSLDTHTLRINWGDGTGIQFVDISGGVFSVTHQYLDDKPTTVGLETMYINLVVVDDDLGMDVASTQVEVHNLAPSVAIGNAPETSPEGTLLVLTSQVTDPGSLDTFTYSWSVTKDGSAYLTATTADLSLTPDDAGNYVVSLTVTDDDGGVADAAPVTITVSEVAPVAAITGPETIVAATPTSLTLSATDPSSLDQAANFTFHIDWDGDGDVDETVVGPSGTVVIHAFATLGNTTIKVTATDQDGSISQVFNKAITVVAFEVHNGALKVGGTAARDQIRVKDLGGGTVEVLLNGATLGTFTPELIQIHGGDGNDRIVVDSTVRAPVHLFGGAGDDQLSGGKSDDILDGGIGADRLIGRRGHDILIGGEGDDFLDGSSGNDLLIGGLGRDRLNGADGENILIGGVTEHDQSPGNLAAIRNAWTGAGSVDQRINQLKNGGGLNGVVTLMPINDVPDDGTEDQLDGSRGVNWFISFVTDRLNGRNRRSNRSN